MTCSHCGGKNYNRGCCYYYKNGIDPKMNEGTRIGVQHHVQQARAVIQIEDDPVITQDHNLFEPTQMLDDGVIATLIRERHQSQQSQTVQAEVPLPECEFIAAQVNLTSQRPMPPSQAQVLEQRRSAKEKAIADKKEAEQLKKLQAAQVRAKEAEVRKLALAEKRAQEAEQKRIALAEKRAAADEARKLAAEEKRIATAAKKAQADEAKKKLLEEKRAHAEEAKNKARTQQKKRPAADYGSRPGKKVSMFDELRG